MKNRLLTAIALVTVLALCFTAGCNKREAWGEGKKLLSDIPRQGDMELPRPDNEITSRTDLAKTLNWMAFYRIDEKLTFHFADSYGHDIYNPYQEYLKAYQMADLADVYPCQLDDGDWTKNRTVGIKYSISKDLATESPSHVNEAKKVPSFDYKPVGSSDLKVPLEEDTKKTKVACETSEQLYFLAMAGFHPVPAKGSAAEQMWNEALKILRGVISADMTDFQKIKAVYDYLTTEVVYDNETAYSGQTYLARARAYYLEGVFLDKCAVCDGKAKAYALLLNMLDIPCFRDTGASGDGDHAWNMVKLSDKWYISCTTYGQADYSKSLDRIVPNYATLLAGRETPYRESWGFAGQKHGDIRDQLEEKGYEVYKEMSEQSGVKLQVSDIEELKKTLGDIEEKRDGEYKVEIEYTGLDEGFTEKLTAYVAGLKSANAAEVKSEGGKVYQIIYLR